MNILMKRTFGGLISFEYILTNHGDINIW
uniref:Uncharacterized protein n=1 Tax=Anguilla anguilla TaxID=7936 RepID=A0A0E9VPE3_ANGAN